MTKTGIKHSELIEFNHTVDYQQGGIVSKEVVKKDTGTVTLFAFDKGQGLSPHSAPYDAMVQVIDGSATITIGENEFEVGEGAGIIMPANITHALQADQRFKMILTMIKS